jgi:hypothetical protein
VALTLQAHRAADQRDPPTEQQQQMIVNLHQEFGHLGYEPGFFLGVSDAADVAAASECANCMQRRSGGCPLLHTGFEQACLLVLGMSLPSACNSTTAN